MGWNQFHCEDYQNLIPTNIHGSKSKLGRPRYHENGDNTPIDAPLSSKSHNFWFDRLIFKIHTFSEIGSQYLSKGVKINPIRGSLKLVALEGPLPQNSRRGNKKPQAPFRPEGDHFLLIFSLCLVFLHDFPSFQTQKPHKKTQKTHESFLILLSSPKTQGIFLIPNLLFLGSTLWIWDLGVWM